MRRTNEPAGDTDPLELATEHPDLVLRELSTPTDDEAYFSAVRANVAHLSRFGDMTAAKYQTLADVERARLNAGSKIRMGIWREGTFVGTVNATPDDENNSVEIGYWLDERYTGNGYATVAVRALSGYVAGIYDRVYAEVAEGNVGSAAVLERAGFQQVSPQGIGHLVFELVRQSHPS